MAAVASSGMGGSVISGHRQEGVPITRTPSQWDTKRHIAFSHVAHLGVDSVLFALRLRAGSMDAEASGAAPRRTGTATEQEDPAARGRRNRDKERARRDAKRMGAAADAAAAAKGIPGDPSGGAAAAATSLLDQDAPCKNKACVKRATMEDKLEARWEQVTEELGAKIKGLQKLKQSVDEVEKQRDAALEEIASLKETSDAEAAWAEQRKQRLQASEVEERRILEESQRLEVELRKLRTRYQEETQQRLPMPHGSIISEADAWAQAAAAAATPTPTTPPFDEGGAGATEGEEGYEDEQPPQPFVSDGLTVSFFPRAQQHEGPRESQRWQQQQHPAGKDWSEGLTRPPRREHPGRFGRWGPETAREQWSCCLWEGEADCGEGGEKSRNGDFDAADAARTVVADSGDGRGRRGRGGGGVAGGCEFVPPHPDPGGMTTADDVRLVWRRSERDVTGGDESRRAINSGGGSGAPRIRHEAWGADGGRKEVRDSSSDDRELWRPILATRINGGGAAWSLIGHGRRPQTANGRMSGPRPVATSATAVGKGNNTNNGIAPGPKHNSSVAGLGGGGGFRPAPIGAARSNGLRRRPGSAPPPTTNASRHRQHHNRRHQHDKHAVRGPSPLNNLRSARAKAGWRRQRPAPVGTATTRGLPRSSSSRINQNDRSGVIRGDLARKSSGGGDAEDVVRRRQRPRAYCAAESSLRSRSLTSLNAASSTYSVYSKGDGRGATAAAASGATSITMVPGARVGGGRRH